MEYLKESLQPINMDRSVEKFLKELYEGSFGEHEEYDTENMLEWKFVNICDSFSYIDPDKIDKFKSDIVVFAHDYESGVAFAFWKKDSAKELTEVPIVMFDDFGNFAVIAESIYDFAKIAFFGYFYSINSIKWPEDIDIIDTKEYFEKYWTMMHNNGFLPKREEFELESVTKLPEIAKEKYADAFEDFILSLSKKGSIDKTILTTDFLNRLDNDCSDFFFKYVGCARVDVEEITQLENSPLSHDEAEFKVVFDKRSQNKTFVIEDHYIDTPEVKIKLSKRFGIDYSKKSPDLCIDTATLLERYKQISYLLLDWADKDYVEPYKIFDTKESRDEAYQKEKEYFIQDPYLALYWLVYFGLNFDSRYDEVKTIVLKHSLQEKLAYINEPLAFFDEAVDVATFTEKVKESLYDSETFLAKLSHSLWLGYLYNYRGGKEAYKAYNATLLLYPEVEQYLIRKVRWVKNNVEKYDLWDRYHQDFDEIKDIALTSYIQACNPTLSKEERGDFAKAFIDDLNKHKKVYKSNTSKSFAQIMLWDIRDIVNAKLKDKYRKIVEHYFSSDKTSKEYLDILKDTFCEVDEEIYTVAKYLDKLKNIETNKEDSYKEIVNLLSSLDDNIAFSVIENTISNASYALKYYLFKYLYMSNIVGKKDLLLKLFIVSHYSPDYFLKEFLPIIDELQFKDKDDENFLAIKESLEMSDKMLLNYGVNAKYDIPDIRGTAFLLMGLSIKKPFVFEFIINLIDKIDDRVMQKYFYENFAKGYNCFLDDDCEKLYKFFPTELFDEEQYLKYVNTLILRGEKDYKYEGESFVYSYSLWSLGESKINKNISLKYVYELILGDKLDNFKLSQKIVLETKNELASLLKKSLFKELESHSLTVMYPVAGSFKYCDDFLSFANENREFKDNFFLWAKHEVDWQYGTYNNIIPILKDLLEDNYLYALPFASHGNEYCILDIYIFDCSIKSVDIPIYRIAQDSEKKWMIEKKYNNFKQFKAEIGIEDDENN